MRTADPEVTAVTATSVPGAGPAAVLRMTRARTDWRLSWSTATPPAVTAATGHRAADPTHPNTDMVDMPAIVRHQDRGALRLDHKHDQA